MKLTSLSLQMMKGLLKETDRLKTGMKRRMKLEYKEILA